MITRFGRTVLLLTITGATLATSCVYDVILVNRSDHSVEIVLTPLRGLPSDPECKCPDGFIRPQLAVAPAVNEGKARSGAWVALDSLQVVYEGEESYAEPKILLTLPPRTALLVGRVLVTGSEHWSPYFAKLQLVTPEHKEQWAGIDVQSVFRTRMGGHYVYEFGRKRAA